MDLRNEKGQGYKTRKARRTEIREEDEHTKAVKENGKENRNRKRCPTTKWGMRKANKTEIIKASRTQLKKEIGTNKAMKETGHRKK